LTKYVVRSDEQVGPRVGLLYATNTMGAVGGTIVAGFLLLPMLGLKGTVYVGVAVNLLVFIIAALIAKVVSGAQIQSDVAPSSDAAQVSAKGLARRHIILPLMLLSGANSFVYEVLWTRLLGHILGGSVAAFATMLASFLGGITIGSAIAARFATTRAQAIYGLIAVQCGVAIASALIYHYLPLAIPEQVGLKGNVLLAVVILLPATLFFGASYPFAVRIFALSEKDAAPAAAKVYAWNTVGAIVGATVAAFFLIPALKYEGAVKFAVLMNLALAVIASLLIQSRNSRRRLTIQVATVFVLLATALGYRPDVPEDILRTSPVYAPKEGELRYYEVGRSATVVIFEEAGFFNIRTNGLPEASTNLKGAPPYKHNQRLLSALPVLARPDIEDMLVVGFGAGATLEGVPPSVKSIDVIELEPEVIAANQSISAERQIDPLADPRIKIFINDARSALALTNKRYDAIVSQPSHPWTAGASHLYTREFMSLASDHLTKGGVFLQWMNTQFVNEELLKSLCATMLAVFDHVRVYQWDPEILFFLGSSLSLDVEVDIANTGRPFSDNPVHYLEMGVGSVEDVVVALAMDHENVLRFAGDAIPITDNFNQMATQSARAMDNGETLSVNRLMNVLAPFDPLVQGDSWLHESFPTPLNYTYISRRLEGQHFKRRAVALADTLLARGNPEALIMIGQGQYRQGETEEAQRNLIRAIDLNPDAQQARYTLLRPWFSRLAREPAGLPKRIRDEFAKMKGSSAVVTGAWLAAGAGNYNELAIVDPLLAEVLPTDMWYLDAVKLRADWRIKVTNPDQQPKLAREATRLIDNAIAIYQDPDFYSMRLASSFVADDVLDIVETARRLIYIFEQEVDRAEHGEVIPDKRSITVKLRQVEAVQQVLSNIREDDRIPTYKLSSLDARASSVAERLRSLPAFQK
jgi:predicted membrane-bound spermidine synthase